MNRRCLFVAVRFNPIEQLRVSIEKLLGTKFVDACGESESNAKANRILPSFVDSQHR